MIQIDEGKIQAHLGEVVCSTVEETLNAMMDAEADRLCRAERYERTEACKDARADSYQRQLHTKVGPVSLNVPKLRRLPFETAIIERYKRREFSGGSSGGDVCCRGECSTSRRHHRSLAGHAGEPEHGERTEPEGSTDRLKPGATDRSKGTIRMCFWMGCG